MGKLFRSLFIATLFISSTIFTNCTSDEAGMDDSGSYTETGLYSVKDSFVEIQNIGGEVTITFLSLGSWSVTSDSEWCEPITKSGESGDVTLSISVEPYGVLDADAERNAYLTISIDGFSENLELCQIRQATDVESSYTTGNDVNVWISEHMSSNYLWNDEFTKIRSQLSYWADADTFFNNAMNRMENIDEDGSYYSDGTRYYYSSLTTYMYTTDYSAAPQSRAMSSANNYGINMVYPVWDETGTYYYFLIAGVYDESPAYNAGLRRGMYITEYNEGKISNNNLEEYYNALMGYSEVTSQATLKISQYQKSGISYSMVDLGKYYVTPSTYTKNPVIFSGVYKDVNPGVDVGYLVYSEFDMNADDNLLDIISNMKTKGASELILDLRYNPGGDVYASTVMATAITGAKSKGGIYCEMEYNEYRKSLGLVDYFYIGENPSMVDYSPIVEALSDNVALNLDRVYVITTGFTASASELIINGLRGLGVEVYIVGQTTEGKNSGMEVISSLNYPDFDFGNYVYEFAPITFYNCNAEGFKDFHDGFAPDYEYVETADYFFDWDEGYDKCLQAAIYHIQNGVWSSSLSASAAASATAAPLKVALESGLRPRERGARVYSSEVINKMN